jgi:hypothetical protein
MKRRCLECREYFDPAGMIKTPAGWFCQLDHAVAYAQAKALRQRQKTEKASQEAHKREKRQLVENHHPTQFRLARLAAQRLANRLDRRLPCICCSAPRGKAQFCGGHYKTAGGHPELALDLRNIHGQRNRLCNQAKSGNIHGDKHSHGYTEGLGRRYGQKLVDWLSSYQAPAKWTCDELRAIRAMYDAEVRVLEKGGQPTRNWRALDYNLREVIAPCAERSQ